jgi:hypothetical protein
MFVAAPISSSPSLHNFYNLKLAITPPQSDTMEAMETITNTNLLKSNQQPPLNTSKTSHPGWTPNADQLRRKTLRLALFAFLIISLVQAAPAQPTNQQHASIKRLGEKPTALKEQLMLPSGPITVDAENAFYTVTSSNRLAMPISITVFHDEHTKQFWVGQPCDAYASTEHGIIGFTAFAGSVFWTKPMLNIDTLTNSTCLNDVWKLVDEKIDPQMLLNFNDQPLFRGVLDHNFDWSPSVSCSGSWPQLKSVTPLKNNAIQIDVSSPDGKHQAIGIFDSQTLEMQKVTQDGKQVFPK